MATAYIAPDRAPTRAQVDATEGPVLLEFGTSWCGFCRAAAPQIASLLQTHPQVRHIRIEDGPGQPLGRSFRVKLWPNLVFLKDGVVLRQLARPSAGDLKDAFALLTAQPTP